MDVTQDTCSKKSCSLISRQFNKYITMHLSQFFTTYDDTLTQSLNTDPLGMTMIWSRLGQDIFHNRVSSISNDVRNYTLNLVHHYVIKQVVDSQTELSRRLHGVFGHADTLSFKQACLIYMENIYVFSMLQAEEVEQFHVQTQGILGTSKARQQLAEGEPSLLFTNKQTGQLLVRQLTLGASGRYKTPFTEMAFFDKEYRYHLPTSTKQWNAAQFFIGSNRWLNELVHNLAEHLVFVVSQNSKLPQIEWNVIPDVIKRGYAQSFATPATVGKQSKAFWLKATSLDKNAAGSLYEVINSAQDNESAQSLFEQAITREQSVIEKTKMLDICRVEPLLAECELLLTVLMSQRFQSDEEVYQSYLKLDRNVSSIIQLARELEAEIGIKEKFQVGVAKSRYEALLAFGKLDSTESAESMTALIEELLKYHRAIMNQRGQSPWVERDSQGVYRCHVKLRNLPTVEQRPYKSWVNGYYLDQFKNLIKGLEGKSNDENI